MNYITKNDLYYTKREKGKRACRQRDRWNYLVTMASAYHSSVRDLYTPSKWGAVGQNSGRLIQSVNCLCTLKNLSPRVQEAHQEMPEICVFWVAWFYFYIMNHESLGRSKQYA